MTAETSELTAAQAKSAELKAARGTKRTCQSCEERFYDLNRDPIICPLCGATYVLAVAQPEPEKVEVAAAPVKAAPVVDPEAIDEDAAEVADIETDDTDADDDTFLETDDEEGTDVTGIIGATGDDEDDS